MRARASRFSGGLRIGVGFFARWARTGTPAPLGLVDRIEDLAHPGVDPARIHPDVIRFFDDTSGLDLAIRSEWRFPFSWAWAIGFHVMRWIGQFVYPRRTGRVRTRLLALEPGTDGREDARALIRTYSDSGDPMHVVAYATWENDGTRYMSAAFPMPAGRLMGILRLDPLDGDAAVLTSRGGDAGVWFVIGGRAVPLPFGERMALWSPSNPEAPPELPPGDIPAPSIVGRHDQTFFGIRIVTHHYWFWSNREPRSKT